MQKFLAIFITLFYTIFISVIITSCAIVFLYPLKYENDIKKVCAEFEIPPHLFCSLINTESSFNPNAKSPAGAVGLTQILPSTAQYICLKNNIDFSSFDLYNPSDNLYLGAMYLNYLFNKFTDTYTALSAYNAGETVVRNWLNDARYSTDKITLINIPYTETKNYINKIKNSEKIYLNLYKF